MTTYSILVQSIVASITSTGTVVVRYTSSHVRHSTQYSTRRTAPRHRYIIFIISNIKYILGCNLQTRTRVDPGDPPGARIKPPERSGSVVMVSRYFLPCHPKILVPTPPLAHINVLASCAHVRDVVSTAVTCLPEAVVGTGADSYGYTRV